MRFVFNEEKAGQAAAFLIRQRGGRMNSTVVLKELYLADRTALLERGVPITGDRMVSMEHGTALSEIYNLLKMPPDAARHPWFRYVSARDLVSYEVSSTGSADYEKLSEYEVEILQGIDREHGGKTWRQMREFTHALPEYEDPGKSSRTIQPEAILKPARSQEEIEDIRAEAEAAEILTSLARSC